MLYLLKRNKTCPICNKKTSIVYVGEHKEEYMRTHSNPLRVMISGVLVDFNGYKPEDFAKVACNTISTIMLKKGENKVRNEIKATLGII